MSVLSMPEEGRLISAHMQQAQMERLSRRLRKPSVLSYTFLLKETSFICFIGYLKGSIFVTEVAGEHLRSKWNVIDFW